MAATLAADLDLRRGFRRLAWTPILLALGLGLALRLARANGAVASDLVYWMSAALLVLAALFGWVLLRGLGWIVTRIAPKMVGAGTVVEAIERRAAEDAKIRLALKVSGAGGQFRIIGAVLRRLERGDFSADLVALGRGLGLAAALIVLIMGTILPWPIAGLAPWLWLGLAASGLGGLVAGLLAWAAAGFSRPGPAGAVARRG